jgi:putative phosphoesterase
MKVGLVSDTHGLLDPKLPALFEGCDLVLHAGDIVKPEILEALSGVAPVLAVRGNNDHHPSFVRLPETALVPLGELTALLVHDLALGHPSRREPSPRAHGSPLPQPPVRPVLARHDPELVIHGHSHRPEARREGGTLFVNPGSAGPRRFSLPRTAAILSIRERAVLLAFFDLGGDLVRPFGDAVEAAL